MPNRLVLQNETKSLTKVKEERVGEKNDNRN